MSPNAQKSVKCAFKSVLKMHDVLLARGAEPKRTQVRFHVCIQNLVLYYYI